MTALTQPALSSDLCICGHWSRHHNVGKHGGCGHCGCKSFSPISQARNDIQLEMLPEWDGTIPVPYGVIPF